MCKDKDEDIIGHIEALREAVLKSFRAFGAVLIPVFFVAPFVLKIFLKFILRNNDIALNYFSPVEVFIIQIKTAMLLALIVSFPYILKQLWNFCAPALYEHEKKFITFIIFTSSALFIFGALFCIFVILPLIINFGLSFKTPYINPVFGISNVMNLSLWLILAFGLMFQLPLLTFSLIKTGLVSYEGVKNCRPYVIVGILVSAGILTPPDIVSQIALFIPAYFLFELGLLFSKGVK